jgi:hypothetical protein
MDDKKIENPIPSQDEPRFISKSPKPILRNQTFSYCNNSKVIKKTSTFAGSLKNVTFPDKIKKPMHIIHEIDIIGYRSTSKSRRKSKKPSCNCVIV